jgi:hypothetical protein
MGLGASQAVTPNERVPASAPKLCVSKDSGKRAPRLRRDGSGVDAVAARPGNGARSATCWTSFMPQWLTAVAEHIVPVKAAGL